MRLASADISATCAIKHGVGLTFLEEDTCRLPHLRLQWTATCRGQGRPLPALHHCDYRKPDARCTNAHITAHKQTRHTTHPDTAAAYGGIGKTERGTDISDLWTSADFLVPRTFECRPIFCCADLRAPTDFLLDVGRDRIRRLTLHPPIFAPIFPPIFLK